VEHNAGVRAGSWPVQPSRDACGDSLSLPVPAAKIRTAGLLEHPPGPATRLDVRRPRPGARRRRIVARVLVGLLVLLALVAIWVAVGLLEVRQDRLVRAAGVAGVVAGAPDLRG
jgi:hypothetical protein